MKKRQQKKLKIAKGVLDLVAGKPKAARPPIAEGLDATRRLFARLRFDAKRSARLLEALGQYQRKWDPAMKVYAEKPLHNWASDYARLAARPGEGRLPLAVRRADSLEHLVMT
jgi:hypothetical protein